MDAWILYSCMSVLLLLSFLKDRGKTKRSLKKAWKAFENILPQFLVVLLLIGVILALADPDFISRLIGAESGWLGVMMGAIAGSVVLIPGFVAFPMAAMLLENGAGMMQIAAFVSTLMMVGIVTMPVEMQYFDRKITILRNGLGFLFSLFVALVVGWVVG